VRQKGGDKMAVKLFEPYTVKNVTFKNRIVMSPMCMYSAENQQGFLEDWHYVHYTTRAVGQVGLIIVESTAVLPEGRISPKDLGIWSDDHIEGFAKLVSMVQKHGAKIGIQLGHAGRKADLEGDIYAPSAIAFNETSKTPKEMTKEDIQKTIRAFQEGARRAKEAGFDVIEIHAAHGYLINQFLSPLSNKRTDEYGGSAENRLRFLIETIKAVKEVWDGPLFVRVSANDYHEKGLTPDDYVEIAKQLKEQGVDLIDVSSGAVVPAKIHAYPGYQVPFAEKIKHGAGIAVGTVGLITSSIQAEEILQNDRADLVFLARELLREPYWPRKAAKELNAAIEAPVQYSRGW
jgi:NADPH2 dehydrogenase